MASDIRKNGEHNHQIPKKVTVVLGAQWGDEGKGKVVDVLAAHADLVCRCQYDDPTLELSVPVRLNAGAANHEFDVTNVFCSPS
ncbi:hypothetical protein J6590_039076 [Homalodisca vitripennis]|nr:hypothetical protein J6590_039076 [Homalodisca vitripennis]